MPKLGGRIPTLGKPSVPSCVNCDWWLRRLYPANDRRCTNPASAYHEAVTTAHVTCPKWEKVGSGAMRAFAP